MKYSVIKCKNVFDSGETVKTYSGLFSWFLAVSHSIKLSNKNDGFIYGIKK